MVQNLTGYSNMVKCGPKSHEIFKYGPKSYKILKYDENFTRYSNMVEYGPKSQEIFFRFLVDHLFDFFVSPPE